MSKKPALSEDQKRELMINYIKKYGYTIFIETGTCLGDTCWVMKDICKEVYSVEFREDRFKDCVKRFKNYDNVKLFNGDSKDILPVILKNIKKDAFFWLDAHNWTYSPALQELNIILQRSNNDLILIDDMRHFNIGRKLYPTQQQLIDAVKNSNNNIRVEIKKDIMRIGKNIGE